MRKIIVFFMAITMMIPMTITASADGQTILTTDVPLASYELIIPSETPVKFGDYQTELDMIRVENASGFASNKNLRVTVTYEPFKSDTVSTTIPFELNLASTEYGEGVIKGWASDSSVAFSGLSTGGVSAYPIYESQEMKSMFIRVNSTDWGKALGGSYKATLNFTSEVYAK